MSTSITVKKYLDTQDVRYATIACPGEDQSFIREGTRSVAPGNIAKAVILKDLRGLLMAVIPGPNVVSLDTLNRQLHRSLELAQPEDYKSIFDGYAPGVIPPLGEAYGMETIIDDKIIDKDTIYFVSGNCNELIRVSGNDFQLLHSNAWYGNTFSTLAADDTSTLVLEAADDGLDGPTLDMKEQIEKITNLPPMPTMAQSIIQLNTNPYAHADDLAKIVENDPSLSAQIIRYAQSPFYGYQGSISSVRQAISRVLGYDMVMNIALGIAATRPFKNTLEGPLGLHAFWRHATYTAALAQGLCNAMPRKIRPRAGTTYLCGLLHNFGYLILGYLFPKEFARLNDAATREPNTPITDLEMRILGTTHMEIGTWLMQAWNMPPEIIVSMSEHHNPDYSGPHSEYAQLIMIADILLKSHDIGDSSITEVPLELLDRLGINEEHTLSILDKTLQGREDLDTMARQLAA